MATPIAAREKNVGDAEELNPSISKMTTTSAMAALHIVIDDRIAVRRSLAARSSYLFMTGRFQNISLLAMRAGPHAARISAGIHRIVT